MVACCSCFLLLTVIHVLFLPYCSSFLLMSSPFCFMTLWFLDTFFLLTVVLVSSSCPHFLLSIVSCSCSHLFPASSPLFNQGLFFSVLHSWLFFLITEDFCFHEGLLLVYASERVVWVFCFFSLFWKMCLSLFCLFSMYFFSVNICFAYFFHLTPEFLRSVHALMSLTQTVMRNLLLCIK